MKKRICYAVICSMFLAAAMTGCGGKDSGTTAAPAATEAKADTEAQSDTEAQADTEAPAETKAPASSGSLASAAKVTYNGVTFGTGDKASDVVAQLGEQVKPSESSQPCVPGAGELTRYYFNGLTVTASQYDVIYNINFSRDNGDSDEARAVGGAGLGSDGDAIKAAFGTPVLEDEYGFSFSEGSLSVSVVLDDEGKAMSISIEDMSIEL